MTDETPTPATDKQHNYIGILVDDLGWTSEELAIWAAKHNIDLVSITKEQAIEMISHLKTMTSIFRGKR